MKTQNEIMDKVRLNTVATVAVLMLAIMIHNTNSTLMVMAEAVIIAFWYVQFDVAEDMCEAIMVSELLDDEMIELDEEFFDKMEKVLK